jgi:hypothetical protein
VVLGASGRSHTLEPSFLGLNSFIPLNKYLLSTFYVLDDEDIMAKKKIGYLPACNSYASGEG